MRFHANQIKISLITFEIWLIKILTLHPTLHHFSPFSSSPPSLPPSPAPSLPGPSSPSCKPWPFLHQCFSAWLMHGYILCTLLTRWLAAGRGRWPIILTMGHINSTKEEIIKQGREPVGGGGTWWWSRHNYGMHAARQWSTRKAAEIAKAKLDTGDEGGGAYKRP